MTSQQLIAYIEGLIIDNTNQSISPYKMRSVLIEIVNSLNQSNISSLSAILPLQYDPFTNVLSLPVVDDLTTGGTGSVLSAEQGKVLKQLIDDIVISGGGIPEAPNDSKLYGRKSLSWDEINLQKVTDAGAVTTNEVEVAGLKLMDTSFGIYGRRIIRRIINQAGFIQIINELDEEIFYLDNRILRVGTAGSAGNSFGIIAPDTGNSNLLAPETTTGGSPETIATQEYIASELVNKQDNLTDVNFGAFSNGLTPKTNIVDADLVNITDSADSNKSKKVTWLNVFTNYLLPKVNTVLASFKTTNFLDFTSSGQGQLNNKINKNLDITDYSSTSTIVGFSAFTIKDIQIYDISHKLGFCRYSIAGTSNSTNKSFTINANVAMGVLQTDVTFVDNGSSLTANGRVFIAVGTNVADFRRSANASTFMGSGNCSLSGGFFFYK